MKKPIALAALLLPIAVAGCSHPTYYYPPPPPPPAFSEIARQGFHDGVEAAQRDMQKSRAPDYAPHPRFRNPPVPPPAFEDYRRGFRDGYDRVFRHGPPSPSGYY